MSPHDRLVTATPSGVCLRGGDSGISHTPARAYDAVHMMVSASVCDGLLVERGVARFAWTGDEQSGLPPGYMQTNVRIA